MKNNRKIFTGISYYSAAHQSEVFVYFEEECERFPFSNTQRYFNIYSDKEGIFFLCEIFPYEQNHEMGEKNKKRIDFFLADNWRKDN